MKETLQCICEGTKIIAEESIKETPSLIMVGVAVFNILILAIVFYMVWRMLRK